MTWEEYVKYLKANSSPETIACIEEAQQRAAYANTENHPSSKHIKIDTTKRSPRTLHSKANA